MSIRETLQFYVILRSPVRVGTAKNPVILRGVYPACPAHSSGELAEGLRMTMNRFCMDTD